MSTRRKLFAPTPMAVSNGINGNAGVHTKANGVNGVDNHDDAALAAALAASDSRYSLRRRATAMTTSASSSTAKPSSSATTTVVTQQKRSIRTSAKRSRSQTASSASDSGSGSDFSDHEPATSGDESDPFIDSTTSKSKVKAKVATPPKRTRKTVKSEPDATTPASSPSKPKKAAASPFDVSPRKPTKKSIKLNLEAHEAHPAPKNWETVYSLLAKQRARIVAPVDTMGCEENGRQDRRADAWRDTESPEDSAKRERLATLVSLMLSSQTKDLVTAEAVYNLQRTLPNGLCLQSLLEADDATISSCIAKVGFWRRKTGYLKSAARILQSDFDGDVPRTVDELCSLPGVGPKMAFLALSSMGIQIGIGVDTHVHRLTNRLGWHKTNTPEQTRLNLQSWLPTELHAKINRLLVGFGQVVCVPIGPRCDLCEVGKARLCPSRRNVDPKTIDKRVKVELLETADEQVQEQLNWVKTEAKVKVELEHEHDQANMQIADLTALKPEVKQEESDDALLVEKSLEW